MNNGYVEKLVKKKTTTQTTFIRILAVLAAILISYVSNVYWGIYALLVVFACAYGVYYLFLNTSVEYEFVLIKNELTIEAIYGKNRRKQLHTIDVSKSDLIAPAESTEAAYYHRNTQMKTLDYTSGEGEEPVYLLVVSCGAETVKLYMEFNERMLEGMKQAAPGKVKQ